MNATNIKDVLMTNDKSLRTVETEKWALQRRILGRWRKIGIDGVQ